MNLTRDPWIAVLLQDGRSELVSLQEVYTRGHEIRDIWAKPHEKIALLRLLVCIAQAALDGPTDYEDWEACEAKIPGLCRAYLEKWGSAFELFGTGKRFLQVSSLTAANEEKEETWATKLDLTLATGRNATLFDNGAHPDRSIADSQLAISLLAFQSFSPGSPFGAANWGGIQTRSKGGKPASGGKAYAGDAPCLVDSSIHCFPTGANLLQTLHLNLLTKDQVSDVYADWGKPIWELLLPVPDETSGEGRIAVSSYLGRLVPQSRAALLQEGGNAVILSNGLEYPGLPFSREPSTTCVMVRDTPRLLRANLTRSLWRQLPAVLVHGRARADAISGPLTLRNNDGENTMTLWMGALVADEQSSAKILDSVEAAYEIPAGMFRDTGRKLYEEGVHLAEAWQQALSFSVKIYAASLKLEPAPSDRARQHFWTAIEQHVPLLLRLAAAPEEAGPLVNSTWGQAAQRAAQEAYGFACPHQTPRQIEAFAVGRQQLRLPKPKDAAKSPKKPSQSKSKTTTT